MKTDRKMFWAIGLLMLLLIAGFVVSRSLSNPSPQSLECSNDSDCVEAQCFHSTSCVSAANAPNCADLMGTQECVPGTLDCGQGSCSCAAGRCSAVFK